MHHWTMMLSNMLNIWLIQDLLWCILAPRREKTSTIESIKASLIVMLTLNPMPLSWMLLNLFKVAKASKKEQLKLGTKKLPTMTLRLLRQQMGKQLGILPKWSGRKPQKLVSARSPGKMGKTSKKLSLPGTVQQEILSWWNPARVMPKQS